MGREGARDSASHALIAELGLEPHPEGGWYRRLWTGEQVDTARGRRAAATAIHFLLAPGEHSHWHRVAGDELWLWQRGSALALTHSTEPDDQVSPVFLGPQRAAGQTLWAVVPAGRWQTARPIGSGPVLVTCVVAPGFDWADFTLLPRDADTSSP
ncbi:cupin domain-containing protein [Streptomyces sp. NPDC014006]|uniref:cupin domain-containing protein n=1 Tax=Streptomyces sp. NPDC014006 TaxID=3364870 RepID=UPI0036FB66B4